MSELQMEACNDGGKEERPHEEANQSLNHLQITNEPCTHIELLDACHNMHLLIAFSYLEGMKALVACFGSEGHPFYLLVIGAVVSEFLRPIILSKSMVWLSLP